MVKCYVATSFKNLEEARTVMGALEKIGFKITHNWTHESTEGKTGEELQNYLTDCAERDYRGVQHADLFFLINDPRCKAAFTEFGVALTRQIPIIIAKHSVAENIFFHMKSSIWAYDTVEKALERAKVFYKMLAI
jgi:hypothetical protein